MLYQTLAAKIWPHIYVIIQTAIAAVLHINMFRIDRIRDKCFIGVRIERFNFHIITTPGRAKEFYFCIFPNSCLFVCFWLTDSWLMYEGNTIVLSTYGLYFLACFILPAVSRSPPVSSMGRDSCFFTIYQSLAITVCTCLV